jgi:hypothetical protein
VKAFHINKAPKAPKAAATDDGHINVGVPHKAVEDALRPRRQLNIAGTPTETYESSIEV